MKRVKNFPQHVAGPTATGRLTELHQRLLESQRDLVELNGLDSVCDMVEKVRATEREVERLVNAETGASRDNARKAMRDMKDSLREGSMCAAFLHWRAEINYLDKRGRAIRIPECGRN